MTIYASLKKKEYIMLAKYKKQGVAYLESLSEKQRLSMVQKADHAYFNTGEPLLTDEQYDALRRSVETPKIGAPVVAAATGKTRLPFWMGSLDKVKTPKEVEGWIGKFKGPSYVLTPKLDGVSALYCVQENKLYTRGDGAVGQDISWVLPLLHGESRWKKQKLVLRGELIMKREVFHRSFKEGNARSIVSGLVNRARNQAFEAGLVDFVAYEVIEPSGLTPEAQMKLLETTGVPCVPSIVEPFITHERLRSLVMGFREDYAYDTDGVVCAENTTHDRVEGTNPAHIVAFKTRHEEQATTTTVLDVVWNASKDGLLKPKAILEPVEIQGVRIRCATAFNAAYVQNHGVGPGAVVLITRSGDVIPHIAEVRQKAEPKMPGVPYVWGESRVDACLENPDEDPGVQVQRLVRFFKELGVPGLAEGQVKKLVSAGYDTVPAVIAMRLEDFQKAYPEKTASRMHENLRGRLREVSLRDLMVASNVFGRGVARKSLDLVLDEYPELMDPSVPTEDKQRALQSIKGIGPKTVCLLMEKLPTAMEWLPILILSTLSVPTALVVAGILMKN